MEDKELRSILDESAINLHLEYEFLPVIQYSNILKSIHKLYNDLFGIYVGLYIPTSLLKEKERRRPITRYVPICMEVVTTTQSVFNKITFDKKLLPLIEKDEEGLLNIHLPKWSAILFLVGFLLIQGQDLYKNHLDVKKVKLENEKIQLEIDKLQLELLQKTDDPRVNSIYININWFYREINKNNITAVEINGNKIKAS